MQVLQDDAWRSDIAKDEAQVLVHDLEREIGAADEAGNDSAVAELQRQYRLAEQNLGVAEQEFESVMDQIWQSTQFWYVDDEI